MQIKRNPSIEAWLFDEIRNNWGMEPREGIHLSDLLAPRQAYWKVMAPKPATDEEIMYWGSGRGHEGALSRASGYEHAEMREWGGIKYTPDFFHNFPSELKTRRRNLAEEGKEAEVYEHYLRQLKGYCACENKIHGWLHVWCLVQKQDDGKTKPELASYEVDFTPQELEDERTRLLFVKDLLWDALNKPGTDYEILPLCPQWMCGTEVSTMTKKPYCQTCKREFETEWGGKKHLSSKTGAGHEMTPAEFEKHYEPRCKWFFDCDPYGKDAIPAVITGV